MTNSDKRRHSHSTITSRWPRTPERVASRKLGMIFRREAADGLVVAGLGVCEGESVVDLERLPAGVAAVTPRATAAVTMLRSEEPRWWIPLIKQHAPG